MNDDELKQMKDDGEVYIVKTHEMPLDSSPAIYLVRDGRDSLVSFTWFNPRSQEDPEREVAEKVFLKQLRKQIYSKLYGGWSNNILAWIRRPVQPVVVRFEELIVGPKQVIATAFDNFGLGYTEDGNRQLPSFEKLHGINPYLIGKGR